MLRPAFAAGLLSFAAGPALALDGAQLFAAQCRACHQAASTAMAPTLAGVAGARIAGRGDFAYSPALKARRGAWTDQNLEAFLKAPTAFAPGSRMAVSVPSADARAAIVAYLHTVR